MRNIIKMFVSLLIFFYLNLIVSPLAIGYGLSIGADKTTLLLILNIMNDFITCIIMIILFKKMMKGCITHLKETKKNKKILLFIWDIWVAFASIMVYKYLSAIAVTLLSTILNVQSETVTNQSMVESLLGSAPLMMMIASCIFAPIVEELVFRGSIKEAIKNKKVFITVSGLIFGFMHVTQNPVLLFGIILVGLLTDYMMNNKAKLKGFCVTEKTLYVCIIILYIVLLYGNNSNILLGISKNEIIGSIVYVSLGWYLAHLYVEKNNIVYPILVHSLNNLLSVVLVLL